MEDLLGYLRRKSYGFIHDETGQSMIEYILLLSVVAIPVGLVFEGFINIVVSQYALISIIVGLPFP